VYCVGLGSFTPLPAEATHMSVSLRVSYSSLRPFIPPAFRREFGTDEILDEPQPFFDLIKECYPSWYCGQGKSGDPVYWER